MARSQRFKDAVTRNLAELNDCVLKRRAYNTLIKLRSEHGLDFFRVSAAALQDNLYAHAHRVFDRHKDAASFWYINRIAPKEVAAAAQTAGITLGEIDRIAKKMEHLRHKTHFHIDKKHVGKTSKVWRDANLTGDEFIKATEKAHEILRTLNRTITGLDSPIPDYHGTDIGDIIQAYKKVHPDAPIAI